MLAITFGFKSFKALNSIRKPYMVSSAVIPGKSTSTSNSNNNNRERKPVVPPPPINEYIKADKVRLIIPGNESTENDIMVGIFPLAEAQAYADNLQVDLVLINEKGDPPVCKAIDYGKYKYMIEKRKKENTKKQNSLQSEIKEIKMSYKIEQHDFDVRVRSIQKFLADGDRVSLLF